MSLLLVGVGLAVTATFFVGPQPPGAEAAAVDDADKAESNVPIAAREVEKAVRREARTGEAKSPGKPARRAVVRGPEDRTLKVTIPKMSRIRNSTVPYAASTNDAAFKKHAGVHLRGTGSPWEEEANVYIAGHRLGYPGTDSWLAFMDLNALDKGDRVFLTDSTGKRYVYRVFRIFVVAPTKVSVTLPLDGRNIVTLQTCTLPDYSERLIVQAEKVEKAARPGHSDTGGA